MRITAGILMIIGGLCLPAVLGGIFDIHVKMLGYEAAIETTGWTVWLFFLSLGLTVGGGISAFRRKYWWWALSGAICSVFIGFFMFLFGVLGYIFLLIGILALILLVKRKGEFI